jgi:hypothetical protein
MTDAPETEARVPSTLAIPSLLFKFTCSILQPTNHQDDQDFRLYRRQDEWCVIACLSTAAMRKVTAGTAFSIAEAKVGEVLSSPKR